jgi:ubiquinone/menaquinone biosynthesis C-methylase UbiE
MDKTDLAWTGERLVTQVEDMDTIYHLHRYAIPFNYVTNKVVVDIASGEGYGSNLLAKTASEVYGVDISQEAILFATQKYGKTKNLKFLEGSVEKIPIEDSFADVVVSFETLEHTDKHEEMLAEIKRILKPGGILIISSPDKANYSDRFNRINEFHVKELYMHEFKTLMNKHFKFSHFYYQTFLTGSFIVKENFSTSCINEYGGDYSCINSNPSLQFPLFNIAVASEENFTEPQASYFNGTDMVRHMHFKLAMSFTPYKLGNLLLRPLRFLFKRK